MDIATKALEILKAKGHTQTWAAQRMNEVQPGLNMSTQKLNNILKNRRVMTGPEFIAFCLATETNPTVFMKESEIS